MPSLGRGNFQGQNAFGVGGTALLYDGKAYAVVLNGGASVGLERNVVGARGRLAPVVMGARRTSGAPPRGRVANPALFGEDADSTAGSGAVPFNRERFRR